MSDILSTGETIPRIQYGGDGQVARFSYPFPVFQASDLEVYLDDARQTNGYAVTGAGNDDGGIVAFDTAPGLGVAVTLRRRLTIQRTSDFEESSEFRAAGINDELDTLTAAVQQVNDDIGRALRLGPADTTASTVLPARSDRSSKFLAFDANGQPVGSAPVGPQGPQGPAGGMEGANNLSELTNGATARSNLGLGTAATCDAASGGSGGLLRVDGDGSNLSGITVIDDTTLRANILLNAFRIAVNDGLGVQNMVDGAVDEFEDETGVTTKTGATYDASGDYYQNTPGGYTSDVFNTFTSNTSGNQTVSATNPTLNEEAYRAVADDGAGAFWQCYPTTWPAYLTMDLGSGNDAECMRYTIQSRSSDTGRTAGTWTLQYSDNNADWTTVHSQSGVTWSSGQQRAYDGWPAPGAHRYWRLNITGNADSNYPSVAEWEIMEAIPPADMILISAPLTAEAEPDEAFVVLWEEDVDSIALNTDLQARASCDGGSTWAQATLTEEATLDTGRILTGTADVSGQTGTSMVWKITTHNNKELRVHAVGLEWS